MQQIGKWEMEMEMREGRRDRKGKGE